MQEMEAPAHRQFQGQMGQLASRFSGMGGLGARRSSGFQNTATAASSNFAQDLMSKRHDLRRQAIRDLHEMSSQLLDKRPYERFLAEQPEEKALGGWGGALGTLGGAGIGFLAGGPGGAYAGANIGGRALSGL